MKLLSLVGVLLTFTMTSRAATDVPVSEDIDVDPVTRAIELFVAAEPGVQADVVAQIRSRIEHSSEKGVRELVKLTEHARRELEIAPGPPAAYFENSIYAPVQAARSFVDAGGPYGESQYALMRPWENQPAIGARYVYDFGTNKALDRGSELSPYEELWNYLFGYPPDADVLLAWLMAKFDTEPSLDALATFFAHAYCDRTGSCFDQITIYDAFSSEMVIEMPDGDVIAFARTILGDDSYASPIPANRRRQALYDAVRKDFLRYYQHRTLTEAAAHLFINPDAWLRSDHEGLRLRLFYLFSAEHNDVNRIADRLKQSQDRDSFLDELDTERDANKPAYSAAIVEWPRQRNASMRWPIMEIAQSVLREHEFLHD